jgi:hypothetical protein
MTMNKKKYIIPAVSFIDMKTYGIMEIQGESRFSVDGQDPIKIIQDDPTYEIDAKGVSFIDEADALPTHRSLWDDDED